MVDFVAQLCAEKGIRPAVPVVAAGGITDGRQVRGGLGQLSAALPGPACPSRQPAGAWCSNAVGCPAGLHKHLVLLLAWLVWKWHSVAPGGWPAHSYCAVALWSLHC